jgi:hypothetical protein
MPLVTPADKAAAVRTLIATYERAPANKTLGRFHSSPTGNAADQFPPASINRIKY